MLRFGTDVALDEIAFQPGTWLVRAKAMDVLVRSRPAPAMPYPPPEPEQPVPPVGDGERPQQAVPKATSSNPTRIRVTIGDVPADKARDVVKVAILPLNANSVSTTFDIVITADGGAVGIPRETLDLVVGEGLRQLGLDAHIEIID